MNEHNHRPEHSVSESEHVQNGKIPYWRRAHRDWRVWVGVLLMIVAMVVYTVSGDLAVRPGTQQPLPNADGK